MYTMSHLDRTIVHKTASKSKTSPHTSYHHPMEIQIKPAQFPNDAGTVYNLFTQYANSLGIDLTYQQFQSELNSLPGKYTESEGGALLLARINEDDGSNNSNNNNVVGCVALRRSSDTWCEMKRLYVLDEARGTRLGQRLVEAILARAKELGYRGIRLDTLANMVAAQRLYRKYGFREIEAYYETPIQGTVFMGCEFFGPE